MPDYRISPFQSLLPDSGPSGPEVDSLKARTTEFCRQHFQGVGGLPGEGDLCPPHPHRLSSEPQGHWNHPYIHYGEAHLLSGPLWKGLCASTIQWSSQGSRSKGREAELRPGRKCSLLERTVGACAVEGKTSHRLWSQRDTGSNPDDGTH